MTSARNRVLYKKIKRLLQKHPHYRGSDERLQAHLINNDLYRKYTTTLKRVSGEDLFKLFIIPGHVTKLETIRRTRQKVQENNPHLKSEKAQARKGKIETKESVGMKPWKPDEE